MDKIELLDILSELITDCSNIGAEPGGVTLIDGLEDVMLNVADADGDVTLLFTDGQTMKITVE